MKAQTNLPSPLYITGYTEKFSGHGRTLGWPTANIKTTYALPDGVYLGWVTLNKYINHPATIFIGIPTTMGQTEHRVEAWLIDIEDKDYYGELLTCELVHYVRRNKTFSTKEKLKQALTNDETYARKWFQEHQRKTKYP